MRMTTYIDTINGDHTRFLEAVLLARSVLVKYLLPGQNPFSKLYVEDTTYGFRIMNDVSDEDPEAEECELDAYFLSALASRGLPWKLPVMRSNA